ncbi:hypothetical protein DFA_11730 [Cavenderia fasciculata]|uniref:Crinkler family protein n=1 Tax=Cavenderia fasciculata TaxID=261658 RepID=F4QE22_CACFS|nr:uncharacterized protein DFA_11730 [Cavenderia fasciculata]EGG13969.1 hypothetical protein DFA_11730 [Cavenderia fasciculata]|eukprot:XP_004350677.1 hypothetical protein DFA_11730 [Cavenderia fasciculata]
MAIKLIGNHFNTKKGILEIYNKSEKRDAFFPHLRVGDEGDFKGLLEAHPIAMSQYLAKWILETFPNHTVCLYGFGHNFPFVGRDSSIHQIVNVVNERWEAKARDQKQNPVMVVAGAPGTGKSRLLYEYPSRLRMSQSQDIFKEYVDIYVTYGNGAGFDRDLDFKFGVQTTFSLRVLSAYFGVDPQDAIRAWPGGKVALKDVLQAFKEHKKAPNLAVYLSVDEFQRLLTLNGTSKDRPFQLGEMVMAIGQTQCNPPPGVFFVSLIGGTILTPLKEAISDSAFPCIPISIPLLSEPDWVSSIISSTRAKDFIDNHYFQCALLYIGGWPRALEYFLEDLSSTDPKDTTPGKFTDAVTAARVKMGYVNSTSNPLYVQALIAYSVTGVGVHWSYDHLLGDPSNPTFEELERQGICTRYSTDNDDYSTVAIPLLYISTTTNPTPLPFLQLREILEGLKSDLDWLRWEIFCPQFLSVKIMMFQYLGIPITIESLFGKYALYSSTKPRRQHTNNGCRQEFRSLPVLSNISHKVKSLTNPFPSIIEEGCTNGECVYINGAGAAFDWFYCYKDLLVTGQGKYSRELDGGHERVTNNHNQDECLKVIETIQTTNFVQYLCIVGPYHEECISLPNYVVISASDHFKGHFGYIFSQAIHHFQQAATKQRNNNTNKNY